MVLDEQIQSYRISFELPWLKVLLKVKRLKNMMNLNAFTMKKVLFMKEDKQNK